jgi:hypothetical protein
MTHNVQTRRKKDRPTHIEIGTTSAGGLAGKARVPVREFPTMLFPYKFGPPTMLLHYPEDVEYFKWETYGVCGHGELADLTEKYRWDQRMQFRAVPVELARTLAKIAYSYVVAELGPGTFTPLPITLDVIRCRTTNVSYTVGGDWELPAPDPRGKHTFGIACRFLNSRPLIVVEIRLFPAFDMPLYRVIVGEFDLNNPMQARKLHEKAAEVVPGWQLPQA